jgi:regulator of protease activity HflC (stomatin/prohibitin superfamily)
VLWTVSHVKDEFNLLVASRESSDTVTNSASGKKAPPVNLLSAAIPVQYQVTNLTAWVYNNSDSARLLRDLATREVVRHLVSADLNELMSTGRFAAGEELRRLIQSRADELQLGVRILFVGMADIHPPVAVGAAYERVVGAAQKREAEVLKARAYAVQTNALAGVEAFKIRQQAEARSIGKVLSAQATTSLFTNQIAAYHSSRDVYTQRAYLQTLARYGGDARKYVLATTNSQDVLMLNMEEKISDALLRAPLPSATKK